MSACFDWKTLALYTSCLRLVAAGSGETPASHTFGAMVRLLQALFSIEVVLDHLRNEAFTVIFSPFHCVPPKTSVYMV